MPLVASPITNSTTIHGHFYLKNKTNGEIMDCWYPCYSKYCEMFDLEKKFYYTECDPDIKREWLSYFAGQVINIAKSMYDVRSEDGSYPLCENLIESGRCLRNVAMMYLAIPKDERKNWEVSFSNMGWGNEDKYWLEYDTTTIKTTYASLIKDMKRIGMTHQDLLDWKLKTTDLLHTGERGLIVRFQLGGVFDGK